LKDSKEKGAIAVIGGGISGLLPAYYLSKSGYDVKVFEAKNTLGGWIVTENSEVAPLEWGPNSLLVTEDWKNLLRELEVSPIYVNSKLRSRFIWKDGRKYELPLSPINFLTSSLLSASTKWKLILSLFKAHKVSEEDLSVRDFFGRIFPEDVVEDIINPFLGGIYAGDDRELSAAACFPILFDQIKGGSNLLRALRVIKSGSKHRARPASFKNGMRELIEALKSKMLPKFCLGSRIVNIEKGAHRRWRLECETESFEFDALIFATPAVTTSEISRGILDERDREFLKSICYQDMMVWHTVWKKPDDFQPGYGCLIPRREDMKILGSLWVSEMFPSRFASGLLVSAQFYSGERIPKDLEVELEVLNRILGTTGAPILSVSKRLNHALPQFGLGHRERVAELRKRLPPNVFVAGNYLDGVGLNSVMKTTQELIKSF